MKPDEMAAALRQADSARPRPRYYRSTPRKLGFLCWTWRIVDEAVSPHPIVAQGRTRTERAAWNRLERAYGQLLDGTVKP